MPKQAIICFLIKDDEILLAQSDYRPDKITWNGITGFINDTKKIGVDTVKIVFDAIKVQLYERDLEKAGVMHVYTLSEDNIREETVTITIFICERWLGNPQMTENFRPRFFNHTAIPYEDMFEDTKEWLPKILEGEKVIIEILSQLNEATHQTEVKDIVVRNIFT